MSQVGFWTILDGLSRGWDWGCLRCGFAVYQHGSDGTGTEESGRCTSGAVHPLVVPAALSQVTPGQGRADEQIYSCIQGCGEHSGELVGQAQCSAGVDIHRKRDDGSLICKTSKA